MPEAKILESMSILTYNYMKFCENNKDKKVSLIKYILGKY